MIDRPMPGLLARLALPLLVALSGCAGSPAPDPLALDRSAWEQGASLSIGDPAPPLAVADWLRGAAVEPRDAGRIVVVEFWAPWCGPCLAVMPRLAALDREHGDDLVAVAIATPDRDAPIAMIRETFAERRDDFPARVAIDAGTTSAETWRRAALASALPVAFVVDAEGRIAWIGHPAEAEPVVAALLGGTWSREAARRRRERFIANRATAYAELAELDAAIARGDDRAVDIALDALIALDPASLPIAPSYGPLLDRARRHLARQEPSSARELLDQAARRPPFAEDGAALAEFANLLLDDAPAEAEWLADRAEARLRAEAAHDGDPWLHYLETHPAAAIGPSVLARVRFHQGRIADAIAWQERAVAILEFSSLDAITDEHRDRLAEYRAAAGR